MELSRLLSGAGAIRAEGVDMESVDVRGISTDSRTVMPGDVFIAIGGTRRSGSDYAAEAVSRGAKLIVAQRGDRVPRGLPAITVEDARTAAAWMWHNFYGRSADKMKIICVTGTCGKTGVCSAISQILSFAGKRSASVGTLGGTTPRGETDIGSESETTDYPSAMTTPDPKYLYGFLADAGRQNCEFAVIEASSHALLQNRLAPIRPEISVFTNLSPEHLDFHRDMESYLLAKASLFRISGRAVLFGEDPHSRLIATFVPSGDVTFVGRGKSDYNIENVRAVLSGTEYMLCRRGEAVALSVPLIGDFAAENTALAAVCCMELGIPGDTVAAALHSLEAPLGRMETLYSGEFTVMRDFAHTPAAMERALRFLRRNVGGRIICVFGCGGDRDRMKRAPMGSIASKYADLTVITGDNPRSEDPEQIIADIMTGIAPASAYIVIPDRREAIRCAIGELSPGDLCILFGKGHETWEIDRNGKHPFDERRIVSQILTKNM